MRTPSHWKDMNLLSALLAPLGCLYGLATTLRLMLNKPQKASVKVICVGNLTAGGTGKTPLSVALAKLLQDKGKSPFFVTRGYGGKLQDVRVDLQKHMAHEVGDEPLLLARQAPVIVNHHRYEGAKRAVNEGADVVIMDDGFQNPSLHKDVSLLVIDGETGFGNGFCIPAGPLREFAGLGLRRAQAAVIVGHDKCNLKNTLPLPVFHAQIKPCKPEGQNRRVVAFAGIGRPQKFYNSLAECGFDVLKSFDFPDHHFYSESELQSLIDEARLLSCEIYTTSKDYVKIPAHLRDNFKVLEIEIIFDEPEKFTNFILNQLQISV